MKFIAPTSQVYLRAHIAAVTILVSAVAIAAEPPLLGTLNGPDYLVTINRSNGQGTRIGPLGIPFDDAMTSLEYDSSHQILYGATSANVPDLYTVNPATGAATRVGAPGSLGFLATGMAHNPITDTLYAAGGDRFFRKNLYEVNRTTGGSVLVGAVSGIVGSIQGLGFDPGTNTLYGLDDFESVGARIVTINLATLVATPLTANINSVQDGWNGLAFDPFTGDLFANSNTTMYRINPATHSITTVGLTLSPELHTYGSLTVMAPFVIPEPSSTVLLVLGLLGIVVAHRCQYSCLQCNDVVMVTK